MDGYINIGVCINTLRIHLLLKFQICAYSSGENCVLSCRLEQVFKNEGQ